MDKLLLIDGFSILNRAFYGLPEMVNSSGLHTNGILGFVNIMMKVVDEENPSHIAVAFDVKEKTFRHIMYDAYKGTRKGMPDELHEQVEPLKTLLKAMGIQVIEAPGFEADDIIGTMSRMGEKEGVQVTILSGDRDLLQLATEQILVRIPKTTKGNTTIENYYAKDVEAYCGVSPTEFIDMKGLMGDTSDNIPGVPGIGKVTASKIIKEYHSIENAYEHIEEIKPQKAKDNLREFYDQAKMSKVLATIKLDVELDCMINDLVIHQLFNENSYDLIKQYEMKSLLKYFDEQPTVSKLEVKMNMVSDLSEAQTYFDSIFDANVISIFPLFEDREFLGLGFSKDGDEATFVKCFGFLTEDYLAQQIMSFISKNEHIIIIVDDLKRLLKVVPLDICSNFIDTSIIAYLLNPIKESYKYDDIARDYLHLTVPNRKELLGKQAISIFTLEDQVISEYLYYEIVIPYLAREPLMKMLEEEGMRDLYFHIELPLVFVLDSMEKEGIAIDGQALSDYGDMLGEKIASLEKRIYEEAGQEFNINSPKQLGEILFDKLELPGAKKTKTGYSTNADVLEKLRVDYPIVDDVLNYRTVAKLKSTYADGLSAYISGDGRIHGTFNQTITATGRISSTEPNLQNIPMRTELGRQIRKVFIPKEDYVFVDADYSQIELRVLAHYSKDEKLIDSFKQDEDIHALTASQVFNVPLEEVDSLMRRNAKAVNFGIVYGISAFGLAQDLSISKSEAASYMDSYFNTYPGVKIFQESIIEQAKELRMTTTMYGRKRPIPELASSNFMQRSFGERIAMNSPIQGTAADIIKFAMVRVYQRMKEENLKSRLILQIHDELLIETHKDEIDLVKNLLEEEMVSVVDLSVPLVATACVGADWYEAK